MASIFSSLKRKLAFIVPFAVSSDSESEEPELPRESGLASLLECGDDFDVRPHKRQRLQIGSDDGSGGENDVGGDSRSNPARLPRSSSWFAAPLLVRETITSTTAVEGKPKANRGTGTAPVIDGNDRSARQTSALLRLLPHDVLSHCFSYINTPSDRYGLQVTCKIFRQLSNDDEMLATLELGGNHSPSLAPGNEGENAPSSLLDNFFEGRQNVIRVEPNNAAHAAVEGGEDDTNNDNMQEEEHILRRRVMALQATLPAGGGIILESDTSVTACEKLIKFAAAGNMQAIYMIAMILCYCHENISEGLALLRHAAASSTHLPSIYALALILRDSRQVESDYYLNVAATLGYAPAWQEKLTAAEMRAQFGDLDADHLVRYLDPPGLNRLLGRHYLECQRVRKCQTSHCWNPLCGRWAYKALRVESARQQQQQNRGRTTVELIARLNELAAANPNDDNIQADISRAIHHIFEPANAHDMRDNHSLAVRGCSPHQSCQERRVFSIESLLVEIPEKTATTTIPTAEELSPLEKLRQVLHNKPRLTGHGLKVSRMKMCSSCRRAKYCSKLCQVYDWRSGRHKMECQFL